jgi:cytochrome c biogenesis protein CcdA
MRDGLATLARLSVVALIGLCLLLTGVQPVGAQDAVARFILFYGETCPHCHDVMDEYLPTVYEKYGDQVEYQYIEVWSDPDSYLAMLGLETKLGVSEDRQGSVPALVIGDKVLIGALEIPQYLETYIDEYLAQGGVDFASLEDLPEVILPTPEPSVQTLLFFDSGDPGFDAVNAFFVELGQQYGNQLKAYAADATIPENAEILAKIHTALGMEAPPAGTPQVLVDRKLLVGVEEIQSQLPGLLEEYLAQGGVDFSWLNAMLEEGSTETPTAAPTTAASPEPSPTEGAPKPIYMAYFEAAGCQNCARTSYDLRVVEDRYPQLVVESYSMEEAENKVLNEWLSEKYNVPEDERLSTPMIFVGEDVLIGADATLNPLLTAVSKYATTGAERTWDDFDPAEAEQSLVDRFASFGVLTVLGAGLIDGLNPCAFATLVFFVSYLTFTGRRGRDILFVGLAFALGVFLTYLLVGVGLLKVIQSLGFFASLGRWVYLLTALLCVVLAVFTFRDYSRVRKGQVSDMTLKLPMNLRRRINKVIREGAQVRAFVAMAFLTGFVVSLIELACTGQVYLPTIIYVLSRPELASRAFLYLVLYCLMFILPLIIVFVLAYFGTTSEQLGQFVNRYTGLIKLITALVFAGLALWMAWALAPLFGITSPWNWVLMGVVLAVVCVGAAVLTLTDKAPSKKRGRQRQRRRA